ncbi:MAG: glycosyltransferase family 39 protein [Isosphaeraceae bacterium]
MGRPSQDQSQGSLPLTDTTGQRGIILRGGFLVPAGLAVLAACARFHDLGRLSLWYDEVVTMTLARTPGPAALVRELGAIDATRAPAHPLILQAWLTVLGPSDLAGRAFSALCGVLTVAMVYRLGRRHLADRRAAAWAAALSVASPLMVYYSREARMYGWLTLVTCLAWDASLSRGVRARGIAPTLRGGLAYALWLVVLAYSHPLGLLMDATLAGTSLATRRARGLSWGAWLWPHLVAGALIAPWLPRYLDHPPEYTVGRLPLRFLFGTPIGFIGGNFLTLGAFVGLIAWGLWRRRDESTRLVDLLAWLTVPPLILYVYSLVGHPVFGPNRYTLFVAPAFFLLLGNGLSRLPRALAWPAGLSAIALSVATLPTMVYDPGLKADWRAAARLIDDANPTRDQPVVVASGDPESPRNLETVTAAYYLGPKRPVYAMPTDPAGLDDVVPSAYPRYWVVEGARGGDATVPGLRIQAVDRSR